MGSDEIALMQFVSSVITSVGLKDEKLACRIMVVAHIILANSRWSIEEKFRRFVEIVRSLLEGGGFSNEEIDQILEQARKSAKWVANIFNK